MKNKKSIIECDSRNHISGKSLLHEQEARNYINKLIQKAVNNHRPYTIRGIAKKMGIDEQTLHNYKSTGKYPYLAQFALEHLAEK